jgi:hypothetical protein
MAAEKLAMDMAANAAMLIESISTNYVRSATRLESDVLDKRLVVGCE